MTPSATLRSRATLAAAAFLILAAPGSAATSPPSFGYDAKLPFELVEEKADSRDGVRLREISYRGASGGRLAATLAAPQAKGPHPAILFVHWYDSDEPSSNRTQFLEEALALGRAGAVSLLVDTMWSDRKWFMARDPAQDFDNSVGQVKELRRALDLLLQQPGVDPKRVAYVGHDFGAMYGAVFQAVDRRPSAFVFIAGTKSFSDWYLLARKLEGSARRAVIEELAPLDPARHVAAIAPTPILFQFGDKDPYVPRSAAEALAAAALEPKEVRWYDAGHPMSAAADRDRRAWLQARLELADVPTPRTSLLARLAGAWVGEGSSRGAAVRATLAWEPVLGARFARLSYRLAADVAFEGHAYYSSSDGKLSGTWFDSLGAVYAIEASETHDALVALWGPAGTRRGRTTYRLLAPDTLEVVDEILAKDGSWSEFARLSYRRR